MRQSSIIAWSLTLLVIAPAVSLAVLRRIIPSLERSPDVGLRETHPLSAAGYLRDEFVSVPRLAKAKLREVATAEPPDEPPLARSGSYAFLVSPTDALFDILAS